MKRPQGPINGRWRFNDRDYFQPSFKNGAHTSDQFVFGDRIIRDKMQGGAEFSQFQISMFDNQLFAEARVLQRGDAVPAVVLESRHGRPAGMRQNPLQKASLPDGIWTNHRTADVQPTFVQDLA